MILLTHSVVGGAIGVVLRTHPVLAFTAGFASHFILDAFPHWQYSLTSSKPHPTDKMLGRFVLDSKFIFDLIKIGIDMVIGIIIVYLFFHGDAFSFTTFLSQGVFWGMVGGVLPDFLQFAYYQTKSRLLNPLQKFHMWMHVEPDKEKASWYPLGVFLQLGIIAIALLLFSSP
jgi:hypothetical protein